MRNSLKNYTAIIGISIVTCYALSVLTYAQGSHNTTNQSSDKIIIGLQYTNNFNKNEFHEFWDPSYGIRGFVSTSFHFGRLESGLKLMSFETKDITIPEFFSWFIYLGWGIDFKILKDLRIHNGVNLGSFQMNFEDEETEQGLRNESELGLEYSLRISYPTFDKLNINVEVNFLKIFTNQNINLWYISAGAGYSFDTPKWIKDFLY